MCPVAPAVLPTPLDACARTHLQLWQGCELQQPRAREAIRLELDDLGSV
jgi:hypothetical protein